MEDTYIQAIEKTSSYDSAGLRRSIDALFEALEIEKDIFENIRVLLKPNLLGEYDPFLSVTTNPAVVEAVVKWLVDHGVKNIVIADSPGGSVCMMPDFSFIEFYKKTGYSYLETMPGVSLNYDKSWGSADTPAGCKLKTYNLLKAVIDADYIINIPKLKTHTQTVVSIGVKNLFGCVPDIQKPAFHAKYPKKDDFARMLVELAMTVKPSLTVVDAVDIMEHNGPSYGDRRHLGLLFASKDVFSQDEYIAALLGVNTDTISLFRIAHEKGLLHKPKLMSNSFSHNEIIEPLRLPDIFTAKTVSSKISALYSMAADKFSDLFLISEPSIDTVKCKRCMRCMNTCPVRAISERKGFPLIDSNKCIHCLCCTEVCLHASIKIHTKIKKRSKK